MKRVLFAIVALFYFKTALAAEAPYRPADLAAMREPSAQFIRAAISQARSAMANRRPPAGEEAIYYARGASTLDEWYPLPSDFFDEPPRTGSYYRFTYRGGRLVSTHRNDETGERLSSFICYDQRGFPSVALLQDPKGKPLRISVLTFDQQDRIKHILVLNGENRALRLQGFVHHNGYEETEAWTFDGMRAWAAEHRTLQGPGEVLSFREGTWQKNPSYGRLAYSQALVAMGLEPIYPGAIPNEPLPRRSLPRFGRGQAPSDAVAR